MRISVIIIYRCAARGGTEATELRFQSFVAIRDCVVFVRFVRKIGGRIGLRKKAFQNHIKQNIFEMIHQIRTIGARMKHREAVVRLEEERRKQVQLKQELEFLIEDGIWASEQFRRFMAEDRGWVSRIFGK